MLIIRNSGKKIENKIKWGGAVIHCCSSTTLLSKQAKKVADLRMTIVMPNRKFHSGSYVFNTFHPVVHR
jgi:hypothetical protein